MGVSMDPVQRIANASTGVEVIELIQTLGTNPVTSKPNLAIGCCYEKYIILDEKHVALSVLSNKCIELYNTVKEKGEKDKEVGAALALKLMIVGLKFLADDLEKEKTDNSCIQKVWAAICSVLRCIAQLFTGNWYTALDQITLVSNKEIETGIEEQKKLAEAARSRMSGTPARPASSSSHLPAGSSLRSAAPPGRPTMTPGGMPSPEILAAATTAMGITPDEFQELSNTPSDIRKASAKQQQILCKMVGISIKEFQEVTKIQDPTKGTPAQQQIFQKIISGMQDLGERMAELA